MFLTKLATLLTLALTASATVDISPFISNGVEAEITEFPFLVSIQQINVHVCGASMLSETWILSSARCFAARPINELNIEYGKTIISPGPNGPNKAAISRVVIHEDFTTSQASFPNDISLAESATPMITGFHEPYAKLIVTGASQFQSGTRASHAGWGHIRPSTRTTVLQKAEIHILSQKECTDAAADSTGPNRKNICAIGDSVLCTADVGMAVTLLCQYFIEIHDILF